MMATSSQSYHRPNLKYEVRLKSKGKLKPMEDLLKLIRTPPLAKQSGIIYCLSRYDCDSTTKILRNAGIVAGSYHAGIAETRRNELEGLWLTNKVKIVVATLAFGQNITKSDVRFVIHYSLPKSLEIYFQQSGLAGHDGQEAHCVIFYAPEDVNRTRILIGTEHEKDEKSRKLILQTFSKMVAYCENKTECRRVQILGAMNQIFDPILCTQNPSTGCDNCSQTIVYQMIDVTEESKFIVNGVRQLSSGETDLDNFTLLHFVDIFKGSEASRIKKHSHHQVELHGVGKRWSRTDAERLFRKLVLEGFLKEELYKLILYNSNFDKTVAYLRLGPKANQLLNGNARVEVPIPIMGKTKILVREAESTEEEDGKAKKMKKDVNEPKRPLTAYMLFSKDARPRIKLTCPGMQNSLVTKEVIAQWARLDQETKARYQTLAEEGRVRYENDLKIYHQSRVNIPLGN